MTQSYVPKQSMQWYGGGSWSISTEFFFYLCFPLILPLMLKISQARIHFLIIALCALLSTLPGFMAVGYKEADLMLYTFPIFRIFEFIAGISSALLVFTFSFRVKSLYALALLVLAAFYAITIGWKTHAIISYNFIVIPAFAALLCSIVTSNARFAYRFLASTPIVYLGKISYSLYIIQIPILFAFEMMIARGKYQPSSFNMSTIALLLSFVVSAIIYHLVELPAHKYINARLKTNSTVKKATS
jgi:peptidoglycan/LPS O-acetylase OafA/YrhL